MSRKSVRDLILILGDQLHSDHPALADADLARDRVLMIETAGEAAHVWSHKQRISLFLAAMRHYAAGLEARGFGVRYIGLNERCPSLSSGLATAVEELKPRRVKLVEPGEWRVEHALRTTCGRLRLPLEILTDSHFYVSRADFAAWAAGRKRLLMEHFYREQRRRHDILMDGGAPVGGKWNFDRDNRAAFGAAGPGDLPAIKRYPPDAVTREVMAEVDEHFPDHPGRLDGFGWPVTREQALNALQDFIAHRLPRFGRYQDAMWQGQPFLFHALLSSSLNLKLLNPREVVAAAVDAFREGHAPIAAVEGFVRQVLGWREYVRGVYWLAMPEYAKRNHYGHALALPGFFWTGETDMNCVRQTIRDTLDNGYAHHIQRLMVIGNFALLAGLLPAAVCEWFLAVYVDAVEWVELPNTLGMALHGDGGLLASKPYAASGAYIKRMSNYCGDCRYRSEQRSGEEACPFTNLYWDFLARNRAELARNRRMIPVLKNLDRWGPEERERIADTARRFRAGLAG